MTSAQDVQHAASDGGPANPQSSNYGDNAQIGPSGIGIIVTGITVTGATIPFGEDHAATACVAPRR